MRSHTRAIPYFSAGLLRNSSDSGERLPARGLRPLHLCFFRMRLPGPEETTQSVFLAPRNNVHVEMRNALADAIVDRDKAALSLHALLDGACEQLHVREERAGQFPWKIRQRFIVRLGNQQ